LPSILRRIGTDEHEPPPLDEAQRRTARAVFTCGPDDAARAGRPLGDYWSSRLGTAAGLRAINDAAGAAFSQGPLEATPGPEAAAATFAGIDAVVDVHTHFMADRPWLHTVADHQLASYRAMSPDWWTGLDGVAFYSFAEYLRCVYVESETTVAVLTSPPADETGVPFLTNEEMTGTRELLDRLAGSGRMLHHVAVHPTDARTLDELESYRDRFHPAAWKVYTMGRMANVERVDTDGVRWEPGTQWMLD